MRIVWEFQSSPSREAGSYSTMQGRSVDWSWFQSSPSREAGSYFQRSDKITLLLFQSSPSREAGSYAGITVEFQTGPLFQSSPSREAGSYVLGKYKRWFEFVVPILSQP